MKTEGKTKMKLNSKKITTEMGKTNLAMRSIRLCFTQGRNLNGRLAMVANIDVPCSHVHSSIRASEGHNRYLCHDSNF